MKNMKERFHKLITVILCFLVSMVPKRDEVDDKDMNMWIVHNRKHHRMWKKLFFWLQGPGDTKLT